MNKTYILSKEEFLHNKKMWATYMAARVKGYTEYHLLYLLILNRDVFKGFTPLTSEKKIENFKIHQGRNEYYKLIETIHRLRFKLNTFKRLMATDQEKRIVYSWENKFVKNKFILEYSTFKGLVNGVRTYKQHKELYLHFPLELADEVLDKLNDLHVEIVNRLK